MESISKYLLTDYCSYKELKLVLGTLALFPLTIAPLLVLNGGSNLHWISIGLVILFALPLVLLSAVKKINISNYGLEVEGVLFGGHDLIYTNQIKIGPLNILILRFRSKNHLVSYITTVR